RRADLRAHAVRRADQVRQQRHRGGDERTARGTRGDRARARSQVRRRLSRTRRLAARRGRLGCGDPLDPGQRRRHQLGGRADPGRDLQRPRLCRGAPRTPLRKGCRCDRRAGRSQHGRRGAAARFSFRAAQADRRQWGAADLRRGDHGVSGRARRGAGALCRAARPDGAWQDHRRRPAGRCLWGPGGSDGPCGAGRTGVPGGLPFRSPGGDGRRRGDAEAADARGLRENRARGRSSRGRPSSQRRKRRARRVAPDPVRHRQAASKFRRSEGFGRRGLGPLLPCDARRGRPFAPVAVRGLVRVGGARPLRRRRDDRGDRVSRFLDAARRKPVDATPVWLMRQAGRSLPEYRALRERWTLADIVAEPELCAEVTLQPVRRLGVDAAVMFADIMLPLRGMGVDFDLVEGVGPVIADPIRSPQDVDRLRVPDGEEAAPQVVTAVRRVVSESAVPVVCFAGAPFTLASYLLEGRPSRDFSLTKRFMYSEPEAFERLLGKLAETMSGYLAAQVRAGASAVQLFDSWVGGLAPDDYESRVAPHTRAVFRASEPLGVPRINFGTGTAAMLEAIAATGPDLVSLDCRVRLDDPWRRVGLGSGVRGNLESSVLSGRYRAVGGSPLEEITRRQAAALSAALGLPTFVGMKHAPPFIAEAAEEAGRQGIRKLIGLTLAPHYAGMSLGQYEHALRDA